MQHSSLIIAILLYVPLYHFFPWSQKWLAIFSNSCLIHIIIELLDGVKSGCSPTMPSCCNTPYDIRILSSSCICNSYRLLVIIKCAWQGCIHTLMQPQYQIMTMPHPSPRIHAWSASLTRISQPRLTLWLAGLLFRGSCLPRTCPAPTSRDIDQRKPPPICTAYWAQSRT